MFFVPAFAASDRILENSKQPNRALVNLCSTVVAVNEQAS